MGWLDEQIQQRKVRDEDLFSESIEDIAGAVTGKLKKGTDDEIGTDAILTILKSFGYRSKGEVPQSVTDFNDRLSYLCRPFGLMYRRVHMTENWWKDCIGPILAFRADDGTAVALLPDGFGYHFMRDGKRVKISKKNCDEFTQDAYCFYKPFPNRKLNPIDLVKYALFTRSVKDMVYILSFMGIATLVGLLSPKLSYFMYSEVIESGSVTLLLSTVFFYLCLSLSQMLFGQFQSMYDSIIVTKMDIAVKAATMMRILSLPASFFRKYSSGELANRASYLTSLTQSLMSIVFDTGLSSLFSLAYISSIFKFAPGLVVPALIIICVTIAFSIFLTFTQQRLTKESMEINAKEAGMTYAMVSGVQKIKVAGAEKRAFARWAKLYAKKAARSYSPPTFVRINSVISMMISTSGTIAMYFFAIKTGVNMAEYTAFTAAYGMVFGAFSSLASLATTYSSIKPVFDMAKPIMDCMPEVTENRETVTKISGKIELNNVTFSYDENSPTIFDNLSLTIQPNQYIAIVGKTGCGKSTLVRLLLGFETPKKGSIYYDGKDIKSLDLKSLRQKIGVVMQDGKLFQGDIFSNITISAPWLTLDQAWRAADLAGIAEDIEAMPMGMHTLISEGAGGISGGQKQRLLIARAIASNPKVLIFDEATSALDNITQKKVSDALDTLHCTRIIIAHRLSTIRHCDRIIYLEDGTIKEDGTYDELLAMQGKFAELVERQRLDT